MGDTRKALLKAICAEPAENTPRLAFADYLAEDGDELDRVWAETFRKRVEGKLTSNDLDREQLTKWTLRLWTEATDLFLGGPVCPNTAITIYVHRGLPYAVRLPWERYEKYRDRLFNLPIVRVRITDQLVDGRGASYRYIRVAREGSPAGPLADSRGFLYPYELGEHLTNNTNPKTCKKVEYGCHWYNYKTRDRAAEALNRALVRYGRAAAGLPAAWVEYETSPPPWAEEERPYREIPDAGDLFRRLGATPLSTHGPPGPPEYDQGQVGPLGDATVDLGGLMEGR